MNPPEAGILRTHDGVDLSCSSWQPETPPRGVVVLVHGYGEHSGRYDLVSEFLVGVGFRVVAFDQRGHGHSGGRPAFVADFDTFLADLDVVLAGVRAEEPLGVPVVLWGQSMGGLVVLRHLQTRPDSVAGAVISAPWLATKMKTPWWQVTLGRVLRKIVPSVQLAVELAPETLTRDPERQQAYLDDPLVHHFVTPGLYWAVLDAQKLALADPESVKGPVLFLVPQADQVVNPETTLDFLERVSASGVETCRLEGLLHEPHNEPERGEVFALAGAWLDSNFPQGPPTYSQKK